MMSFEEFAENVVKEIRAKVGGAFQIKEHNVIKNNNVKRAGIAVMKNEEDIGPCVYLDEFYREYESNGMRFDEIVDEVYRLIMKHEEEIPDVDISGFRDWETAHGDIYMKLINAEQNKELLEKIPHRIFMDLAVVYYAVARDHEQEDIGTILLYNEHMEMWGQNEENLYQTAMINMRTDGEANLVSIENIIRRVLPNEDISLGLGGHRRDISMYILTNSRKRFGAAEILDKKTLRMIADEVGDGFIVLPSSIHETIILPPKDEKEYGMLKEMVREVNDSQVDIEERLSYHVYMYSRDEEVLKIVA